MKRLIERFHRMLIVDDNAQHLRRYVDAIMRRESGGTPRPPMVAVAENGVEALCLVKDAIDGGFPFETVVTDLEMHKMNGLELIGQLSRLPREVRPRVVAVSTIEMDRDFRERQLQELQRKWHEEGGQFEYSFRGTTHDQDDDLLAKIWLHAWGEASQPDCQEDDLIITGANDDPLKEQLSMMQLAAKLPNRGLLIVGETGTGKEGVAKAFHAHSAVSDKPYIVFNAMGLAPELADSQLFGHEKGAFTGAHAKHVGFFEAAQGGSVFIDEMQDLPLTTQGKLLRVLQENKVMRVGATSDFKVSFRLIVAFSSDPRALADSGRLRNDLYFRLLKNCERVNLPPLRDRKSAIVPLADHLWAKARRIYGLTNCSSPWNGECRELLLGGHWEGNVRELEGVVAKVACRELDIEGYTKLLRAEMATRDLAGPSGPQNFARSLSTVERHEAIHAAMQRGVDEGRTSIASALAYLSDKGMTLKQAYDALGHRRRSGCQECIRLANLLTSRATSS